MTTKSSRGRTAVDGVDAMSVVYTRLHERYWCLIEDLMGGTYQMRLAGTRWLPRFEGESDEQYAWRVNGSFLYEMYADTVESLVDKPFSKPVTVTGDLPEPLDQIEEDVDREGTSLSMFMAETMKFGVRHGLSGVLVDHPSVGERVSLATERDQRLRPTFVLIKATDLLGFKWKKGSSGERVITQLRFRECITQDVGAYGDEEVERIREINAPQNGQTGTWKVYAPTPKGNWEVVENGTHTYPGVPFEPYYTEKTGFLQGRPPLMKLAWLNIRHWQTTSRQNNILDYARIPMVMLSGITQEEKAKKFVFGPAQVIRSTNAEAKGGWLEHTGKAIEAGERDISKLEERAETLGAEPLIERTNESTATGKGVNEKSRNSSIQRWIRDLEDVFIRCYHHAATWKKVKITDKEFGIDVFDDFTIAIRGKTDMDTITKMREMGDIDQETNLKAAKRRGLLAEGDDIESIMEKTKSEGPPLSSLKPASGDDPNVPPRTRKPKPKPAGAAV